MESALDEAAGSASLGEGRVVAGMRRECSNPRHFSRSSTSLIRVHAILDSSRANGPGLRTVVFVQGCSLRCTGCFNPETHSLAGGSLRCVPGLAKELASTASEGLTVSGGEPTDQIAPLVELLGLYRQLCGRTVLLYSGRDYEEIMRLRDGPALLRLTDAAVLGRYRGDQPEDSHMWGSSNQTLYLLSGRLQMSDFSDRNTEILIGPDGSCTVTGYPDHRVMETMRR